MVLGRRRKHSFTRGVARVQTPLASPGEPLTVAIAGRCPTGCRPARLPLPLLGSSDQALIDFDIILRHACNREPLLETSAHFGSIESEHGAEPGNGLVHGVHD